MSVRQRLARRQEQFFASALLDARSALHLSYRLTIRFAQFASADGAAAPGAGLWRAALPFFAAWDIILYFILRRSDRFGLAWRLPLDALDMAFWSLSPFPRHGRIDNALIVGIPLAIEGGFRIGYLALVVPVVGLAAPVAARWLAGHHHLYPSGFGVEWLVIGVGLGVGLYRYCSRLNAQADIERQRRRAAGWRRAYLAGQNAVAMGASSVVDGIEGIIPIVGRPDEGSALGRLANGWKGALGASTTRDATYLQVAVLAWERSYNSHPDLSSHVTTSLPEGAGTLLLTGSQVDDLGRLLTRLQPRGDVAITVDDTAADHPPGRAVRLLVNGQPVELPGDRYQSRRPVDPGPVAFVFVAAMVSHDASPAFLEVPAAAVLTAMAAYVAGALWAHAQLARHGLDIRPRILRAALVLAVAYTAVGSATARQPVVPGVGTAYLSNLMLIAFLAGGYGEIVRGRLRWEVVAAVAVTVAIAPILSRAPFEAMPLLIAFAMNVTPYFPFRCVSRSLAHAREQHLAETKAEDDRYEQEAFAQGQADVIDLVSAAAADARRQLAALAPTLDDSVAGAASRRLRAVDGRLQELGAAALASRSSDSQL